MVLDKTKNMVLGDGLLHILCKNCSGFFLALGKGGDGSGVVVDCQYM